MKEETQSRKVARKPAIVTQKCQYATTSNLELYLINLYRDATDAYSCSQQSPRFLLEVSRAPRSPICQTSGRQRDMVLDESKLVLEQQFSYLLIPRVLRSVRSDSKHPFGPLARSRPKAPQYIARLNHSLTSEMIDTIFLDFLFHPCSPDNHF